MKKYISILSCVILCTCIWSAQINHPSSEKNYSLLLSFFNHSVSDITYKVIKPPLHPGFMAGAEITKKKDRAYQKMIYTFNLGYYHNKYNARTIFINGGLCSRYTAKFGVFADISGLAGYMHSFRPREIFRLNDNGEYEKSSDFGKPGLMLGFCIGLGYDFSEVTNLPFSIFCRYQQYFQLPYNDYILALPQSMFQVGVRMKLNMRKI